MITYYVSNSEIPFECNTIRVEYLTKTAYCFIRIYHEHIFIFKCDLHFFFFSYLVTFPNSSTIKTVFLLPVGIFTTFCNKYTRTVIVIIITVVIPRVKRVEHYFLYFELQKKHTPCFGNGPPHPR